MPPRAGGKFFVPSLGNMKANDTTATTPDDRADFPRRNQLLLPLLETLREMGGTAKPADAIESLSERLSIPEEVRHASVVRTWAKWGSRTRYPFRQEVHWARADAVGRGLIDKNEKGVWTLTGKGCDALCNSAPGLILTVYETPSGEMLWADMVTSAGHMADRSLNLIFTSPPYPIISGRDYGKFSEQDLINLLMSGAPHWHRALTDDGSLVINLKGCWRPSSETDGMPERSLYIERFMLRMVDEAKFYFADKHFWRNPSCGPTSPWVTIKRIRCGNDMEEMLWFSKSRKPFTDMSSVMEPAKASTIATYLAKSRRQQNSKMCPSGQNNIFEEQMAKAVRGEPIMVLPRTVQTFSNADPQTTLTAQLQAAGLPKHGARMPKALAEWWIKFLTRSGDVVCDPFGGSNTTGLAAESLGRRWISSERSLAYIMGSALRFPEVSFGTTPLDTTRAVS